MHPAAIKLAQDAPELLAMVRLAANALWDAAQDCRSTGQSGVGAGYSIQASVLWRTFGQATDCSICRGWHGPEREHPCE